MNGQRASRRVEVSVNVTLESCHHFYAGVTADLGYGGVFVVTDDPPLPGTFLAVAITLPDGSSLRVQGCVRWVRTRELATADNPPGCGIAWQALDKRSIAAVRRFLDQKAREDRRSFADAA